MKTLRTSIALSVLIMIARPALTQEIDPAWFGTWSLNLGKSTSGGWAKQSLLLFTSKGWVETAIGRNGELAGSAVALGPSGVCTLIAPGPEQLGEYQFVDKMHIIVTLKGPGPMTQTVDIRLLAGAATVEVRVKGIDFYGRQTSSIEVWEKVQPAKKGF